VSWIALRITPDSNRDGVIAALFEAGSQGVQEDGAAVVTHFPHDAEIDTIRNAVMTVDPRADIAISESPDADYSEWRASVGIHQVGALTIAPPWLAQGLDPETTIVVDPAMAFGTGEHPTTRGVIRLMQGIAFATAAGKSSPVGSDATSGALDTVGALARAREVIQVGDVVADLGAGSAVLSIAAAKLGASRIAAIEIDHDSIGNAEENVRINGVSDRVEVIEGDAGVLLPLLAPVRVVLANIVSSILIPMLPVMRSSLDRDGRAILAGILLEERDVMLEAIRADGWAVELEDTEGAWWSVLIAPR
jgi:ribosomal protein L11 methyltransferase